MKTALISIAVLAVAATLGAQTVPPPPPAQPNIATPAAPQANPATPAAPAAPAAPRTRVRVAYRATPAAASIGGSYLGVDVRDLTSDRVSALKLKNDQGVEITMVDQDSPAGKSGLKENDVVVSFNGQAIQSAEQLKRLIRETKPGQSIALGILRDAQPQTVNVTLADRNKMFGATPPMPPMKHYSRMIRIPDIEIPAMVVVQNSRRTGVTVENLTAQLGEYFGAKNGEGVLVRSVEKGSKAEAAGIKAGDVIVRVDNDRIGDTRDWSRMVRNHDGGTVKVGVIRDRREQTLPMTLPEPSSDAGNSFVIPSPDLDELRIELQNLGPELSRQQSDVQVRIQKEFAAHQKEIQKAMRDAQREIERSMRDLQRERAKQANDED